MSRKCARSKRAILIIAIMNEDSTRMRNRPEVAIRSELSHRVVMVMVAIATDRMGIWMQSNNTKLRPNSLPLYRRH